jgi:hypothetical protein
MKNDDGTVCLTLLFIILIIVVGVLSFIGVQKDRIIDPDEFCQTICGDTIEGEYFHTTDSDVDWTVLHHRIGGE